MTGPHDVQACPQRNCSSSNNLNNSNSKKGHVRINVNGRLFVLSRSTCIRIPVLQGMLTRMKLSQTRLRSSLAPHRRRSIGSPTSEELFFERNSTVFGAVVDYVQNNELHVPPHVCPKLFARDLSFWGFDIDEVESCCFSGVVHFLWEQDRLTKFHGFLRPKTGASCSQHLTNDELMIPVTTPSKIRRVREMIWKVLDEPFTGNMARAYFYIMCLFILASFFTIAADTMDYFKQGDGEKLQAIRILGHVCVAYLYTDYFLRILFYPDLRRFCRDFVNVTDGLAVLSSIAKMVAEQSLEPEDTSTKAWVDAIDSLQLLRILRLLRPMSKVTGFRLIYFTLKCSFHELLLVFMLLMFLTMIFSSLLYYLGDRNSIKSIPHAMWFSLTTMTTVGYGDIVPEKARTKIIGSVVAVFGVILMSMTMPIMVSNFNLLYINAVVGQPSAINKVHQDLEKAQQEVSNSAQLYKKGSRHHFTIDEEKSSSALQQTEAPEEEQEEESTKLSGIKACFQACFGKKKPPSPLIKQPTPVVIPSDILKKLPHTRARSPTMRRQESSSGIDSDGQGSDADGEGSGRDAPPTSLHDIIHLLSKSASAESAGRDSARLRATTKAGEDTGQAAGEETEGLSVMSVDSSMGSLSPASSPLLRRRRSGERLLGFI